MTVGYKQKNEKKNLIYENVKSLVSPFDL